MGCDGDELSSEADFNVRLRLDSFERTTGNEVVDFTGSGVALALCDLTREDDIFEIND
ncbi:MAG: hypothetical protein IPJ48_03050 [Propionivibrio sp.]|uniref:Uncharacterized protein n=1 Tax=Candidatus Propionivibrio dominans TaxID=2954373 RepID=A0A9D7I7I4_9RHOO|nr:hypothetical protein [Candidatus Propionivibrio dominans]